MAHRQKHMRGKLHHGTRAGSLTGAHFGGMRGRIRHKSPTRKLGRRVKGGRY